MNKEDKKIQENLVNEMMKVSKTNPDVMIYMQSLMKCYEDLEEENKKLQEEKDHYKHLYSEVKKQKDDVVEYINFLYIINQNINGKFSDTLWGQEILELLGEIDIEDN